MIGKVAATVVAMTACSSASPQETAKGNIHMVEARSPAGDIHPGTIAFDDRTTDRTWTEAAADNPETIAWVAVEGVYEAVLRIEITGVPGYRRMTKFGADGKMLESTTQGRPRPEPKAPIVPQLTPEE